MALILDAYQTIRQAPLWEEHAAILQPIIAGDERAASSVAEAVHAFAEKSVYPSLYPAVPAF